MAPKPRGETERAGGGHPSYKQAHKTIIQMMRMRNINNSVATPPSPSVSLFSLLHPSQPRSVLHSPQIKLANPDNFDGDRSKGRAFLTSCELYLSLTGVDYPDEQARIH
jgi:hypothetical protein